MLEAALEEFLLELDKHVFVKSTISATGKVENLPRIGEDRERTIFIHGEWDRDDLKDILSSIINNHY